MARSYTFAPPAQNPGGAKSLASIISGSLHSFKLKKIVITSPDVAGVTNVLITISRITAIGTGTTLAAAPHMQDDTAFTGTAKHTLTVEPTKTLTLSSKRWNLITECIFNFTDQDDGEADDFYFNAGGADGFCVTPSADTGANTTITCEIEEV